MDTASSLPVLSLRGVRKTYHGGSSPVEVLHGIDLDLEPGAFTALVGPSGSGKSTLLNLLGLLDRPDAGSIRLLDRETSDLDDAGLTDLRGRSLGFVFQFHHLLPAFTARENVLLPSHARQGRVDPALWDRAGELLARLGLKGEADRLASRLSGGQQQRVAVARALLHGPDLVLADEPTGNLDTVTGREVFELMRELNRERHTAFLVVTHDPGLAALCDRVVELVDGRIHP